MRGETLFAKIWKRHQVADLPGDRAALLIDRMTLHELSGGYALRDMRAAGEMPSLQPDQAFAVADHAISTAPDRGPHDSISPAGSQMIASLEESCAALRYRYVRPQEKAHGIVHVAAPEQGFVLPGITLVCGDSHTCTLGAFGALAFAVGSSEVTTVLRHSALIVERPKTLRIDLTGHLSAQVSAKDVALRLLALHGVKLALGYVIEFSGPLVGSLSMEGRMTLCNMAAEMGTRYALIAPDETTFAALRRSVPARPEQIEAAISHWRTLKSDHDAVFERELALDVSNLVPQVTWGTTPMHSVGIPDSVPDPSEAGDAAAQAAAKQALNYMRLEPGQPISSVPIDAAFIGSCTNARISDLRAAAAILKGRKISPGIRAMCTPGSMAVRAEAEAEGLDRIFIDAGFEWRKSGCSNCGGREGPIWRDLRVISSTNRNFENRQGPGTRTHLASPATVAASAVTGRITDPRALLGDL
ncbi:3-isopropylmalate dehydratase large subunit [Rhizobium lusitanum]|uniref:3-isopropylmalate dehydratase n=1 Tax=Rhizobium lusitanum TaxID=293958 RepID=A0A7X0ITX0_9HYPH|nr:3-isopropylmalate dehydratase large subunit [Rhizobium lusitanum]MBB6487113.1 3-isopropylmalate/(R)-2-methylmalate dehydratase large subunit [Rhizobium lusitanum]